MAKIEPMTTGRIQSLTDAVYAIAMTILILNLKVPNVPIQPLALRRALLMMGPKFSNFIISFLLLAVFWSVHHRHFRFIKRADSKLLWINIGALIFVVLIPFSTSLYGDYGRLTLAALFFEANIMALGVMKYVHWAYATGGHRLVDKELEERDIAIGRRLNLVTPGVSLLAMALAFIAPDWSTIVYLAVPLIITTLRQRP